ncbi:MAG: hypothetical protein U9N54_05990 [candidate division Zixibacteria bacterium]|nr:hypothetical protein [candidate division Zixibacteria bacterium]
MYKRFLGLIIILLECLIISQPTQAQENGTIQATATVISAITILGTNDLRFGTVIPGLDKTVDKSSAGFAGEWQISGNSGAEITFDFILPDSIFLVDSSNGMRINFNNTDVSYDDETGGGQTAPAGIVNPNGPSVQNLGAGGTLLVWIGGTVFPGLTQTGGDYAGDIVLSIAYTGG